MVNGYLEWWEISIRIDSREEYVIFLADKPKEIIGRFKIFNYKHNKYRNYVLMFINKDQFLKDINSHKSFHVVIIKNILHKMFIILMKCCFSN